MSNSRYNSRQPAFATCLSFLCLHHKLFLCLCSVLFNFRLDAALFKDCHEDADRLCSAPSFKDGETKDHQLPHGVVLACLYRGSLPHVEADHRVSKRCFSPFIDLVLFVFVDFDDILVVH